MTDEAPRPDTLPAGFDEVNPYADIDLEDLPDWWRRNVRIFRDHGMRPYRPPQFADGELVPLVVDILEAEYDLTIRLQNSFRTGEGDWTVVVDGNAITSVHRRRTEEGRSVYAITSEEFKTLVTAATTSE